MDTSDRAALTAKWRAEGIYGDRWVADVFRANAERFSTAPVHVVGGPNPVSTDLGDIYRRSRRLAGGLATLGVQPGEAVAIWTPNWIEGVLSYHAAWMLGATVVPIVHIYGPREVGFILRQSGARILIMPDRWRSIDYCELFDTMPAAPDLEHLVVIGANRPADSIDWSDLADHAPLVETPAMDGDDRCVLVYTSGTTGDPKGVVHTTNTLVSEVRTTAEAVGDPMDVNLGTFPAGHIAGVLELYKMFLFGTSTILMDRWDAQLAAELIATHGVTSLGGAPFYVHTLLEEAERRGSSLGSIVNFMVGGANVPYSLVERAGAAGVPVFRAYGSTEHPIITTGRPGDPLGKRAGTDGRPPAGVEIRVLDPGGGDAAIGTVGEIVTRGPDMFVGYSDPALDADAFLDGGWFRTGDIGRIDDDGYLTVTDRLKDVIIRGGENIASKEVEDLLVQHPAVVEAAAVGLPDERYGERVAAFVRLREGQTFDVASAREHFERLGVARQKVPELIVAVDDFPRTSVGKVRKVDLRARLASDPPPPSA